MVIYSQFAITRSLLLLSHIDKIASVLTKHFKSEPGYSNFIYYFKLLQPRWYLPSSTLLPVSMLLFSIPLSLLSAIYLHISLSLSLSLSLTFSVSPSLVNSPALRNAVSARSRILSTSSTPSSLPHIYPADNGGCELFDAKPRAVLARGKYREEV